jgi:hypothetical protein
MSWDTYRSQIGDEATIAKELGAAIFAGIENAVVRAP